MNALSDANVAVRRASLGRLGAALWGIDFSTAGSAGSEIRQGGETAPPPRVLTAHDAALLRGVWPDLMKPLLRRCADASEPCRLAAVRMATAFVSSALTDLGPSLAYLIPALCARAASTWVIDIDGKVFARDAAAADAHRRGRVLASHQGVLALDAASAEAGADPSEEVRAAAAVALGAVLRHAVATGCVPSLHAYLHDVIMAGHALAVDPAPDVKQEGCALLCALATGAPVATKHYAVALVRSLMVSGLGHRLARTRLATLAAVNELVMLVDEEKGRGAGSEAVLWLLGGHDPHSIPLSSFYRPECVPRAHAPR